MMHALGHVQLILLFSVNYCYISLKLQLSEYSWNYQIDQNESFRCTAACIFGFRFIAQQMLNNNYQLIVHGCTFLVVAFIYIQFKHKETCNCWMHSHRTHQLRLEIACFQSQLYVVYNIYFTAATTIAVFYMFIQCSYTFTFPISDSMLFIKIYNALSVLCCLLSVKCNAAFCLQAWECFLLEQDQLYIYS